MPSLLVMLLLLCSITFVQLAAYAQVLGNAPVPVNGAAFVRSQTKLFIQGGVVTALGNTVAQQNQMFALDLAVPWNSNSPVWISLKQGPTQGFHTAAMSTDEQTFVTFRTTAASTNNSALSYRFHVGSNVWDQSSVRVQYPGKDGISAVQDPLSGLVYLAGGYQSDDSQMYVYNIDTDTITMFPMPHNYMLDRAHYSGLYLKSRKSILYFGGATSGGQPSMDQITEFIPSTGAWSTLTTYNQNPPHRADFCMVSSKFE
ncbi:hypothetical protein BGZ99_009702 [Dissophora globulifera]|uniref:Kelch repeat-containing protein n=1 Tax=Dissophora globulifera TaxID=979702 RepID=A0A9P6RRD5_9FUNG|nr:hypothetical protein BGZ99_009702 [Dissophora globulifera]